MTASTPFVRTVLGDISASECEMTYSHEHLVLDSLLISAKYPHILLDQPQLAIAEVLDCAKYGIRTMVDAMPCCSGRDVVRLAEISRSTNVNIIAATGLHHERYYGDLHWSAKLKSNELAQLFIEDINSGVDAFDYTGPVVRRTCYKAGIIKVATGGVDLNERARLLFEAASIAYAETGAPIITHCEEGRGALEQIAAFEKWNVPATSILLSHIDKVQDPSYHLDIAQSGAWLLFDQSIRHHEEERPFTAQLIVDLVNAGYGDRIVLGTDGARRSLWSAYSGKPGLSWLAREFPKILTAIGMSVREIDRLFVENPAQALAFKKSANVDYVDGS